MKSLLRLGAVLALPLVLSACWSSDGELLPETELVRPDIEGQWIEPVGAEVSGGDRNYRVARDGNTFLVDRLDKETNLWNADSAVQFVSMGAPWYLADVLNEEDGATFVIFHLKSSREMTVYVPSCSSAVAASGDVQYDDVDNYCYFGSYAALRREAGKLVAALKAGDLIDVELTHTYVRK